MRTIIDEILACPRTPSREQLEAAEQTLREIESERPFSLDGEPDQAKRARDALILSSCYGSVEFKRRALEDFRNRVGKTGGSPRNIRALMAEIAWQGDSEMSIGVATQAKPPGAESRNMVYNFGQAPRHPEWTGFSPLWKGMTGLHAVVAESHWRPREAGMVIAFSPSRNGEETPDGTPFPDGPVAVIRELLQWHGAARWTWASVGEVLWTP